MVEYAALVHLIQGLFHHLKCVFVPGMIVIMHQKYEVVCRRKLRTVSKPTVDGVKALFKGFESCFDRVGVDV